MDQALDLVVHQGGINVSAEEKMKMGNDHVINSSGRPVRKRTQKIIYTDEEVQPKTKRVRKPEVQTNNADAIEDPGNENFDRTLLVRNIKARRYKKVAFLTGAGISVAAGIPDFRTPKTGLYAQLKEFGLPHPEEIFSLEFLLHAPEPFYAVANRYLQYKVKPTLAHHFIKKFVDQGTLLMDYTQNIDGLELDVGIPPEFLVQAHGHMRSAHCSDQKCRAEADIRLYTHYVRREEVLYCKTCSSGIVKPDIVFFGEKLPKQFGQKFNAINKADLVFVLGTSLKVQPFSTLLAKLPETTPLVVLNHTNPTSNNSVVQRTNFLFLEGDIETSAKSLLDDIGWDINTHSKEVQKRKQPMIKANKDPSNKNKATKENKKRAV